jgi:pre-mRNA-splicing factor 38A
MKSSYLSRSKMAHHRADAGALFDNRGYSGPLIRGVNPASLFEKAVRDRITDSYYWKEQCFGLNAATLCDRAVELTYIGGTYGMSQKPTPFLCLAFKMLQLIPEKDVVLEYLNFHDPAEDDEEGEQDGEGGDGPDPGRAVLKATGDFKYLRALAAFYIRLTFDPPEVYKALEPLLSDFRKLKRRTKDGFTLTHIDQFVDDLLTKDRVCATSLWKLPSRRMLEDLDILEERISPLADELEELDEGSDKSESAEPNGENRSDRSEND